VKIGVHAVYVVKQGNTRSGIQGMRLELCFRSEVGTPLAGGTEKNLEKKNLDEGVVIVLARGHLRIPSALRQLSLTHRGQDLPGALPLPLRSSILAALINGKRTAGEIVRRAVESEVARGGQKVVTEAQVAKQEKQGLVVSREELLEEVGRDLSMLYDVLSRYGLAYQQR
jgi:hypothetical protein